MRERRKLWASTLVAVASAVAAMATATGEAAAQQRESAVEQADQHYPGQYIVVLGSGVRATAEAQAAALTQRYGGEVTGTYSVTLNGFAVRDLSEQQARRLAADPSVKSVHQDGTTRATGEQPNPPSWGLDQIDQRTATLDKKYTYPNSGEGVTAYVIDSGINAQHPEFEGRAGYGYDFVDNDTEASDCFWHGSHVSGTIAGKTVGVAKKAKVVAVRSLGCNGSGPDSATVSAMEWVAKNAVKPAVVNMSLGMDVAGVGDEQVKAMVAKGIVVAVSAGNDGKDACGVSPARVPEAITVGWFNKDRTRGGNHGRCIDLFAPGGNIYSSDHTGAFRTGSGTSMASPHVAGAAALYLSANTGATPQQVSDALVRSASPDLITNPGTDSPNKLLYVGDIGGGTPPKCGARSNDQDVAIPDAGSAVGTSVSQDSCEGKASATLPVRVDIDHSYTGDLAIDLVGPSGTAYPLKRAGGVGESGGVHQSFTVDASREDANGTWQLSVRDTYRFDTGTLTGWSITF
ncbi:S8 family serine peptidase [Kibdelosporangium phytohabitans]|uniref:Serine protease n=1 Tax=Kibdelosporangium phytohabitans TaxID=860235 RepID=A0A0N9I3M6_9PSEU|nr:S8 family serine peptidase [Kibdelosporangium phytohabitans]ALG10517.1 serine protease [Kibdelosporangium phytohabitans]MBE1461612.1 subtilisin family serine protease [Kibdelosporangium phytohabitans]